MLFFQGVAQFAQVPVVAAVLQVVGDGGLGRHRGAQRSHQFQPFDLLRISPGGDPADAVAGGEALGEGTAMHHQPFGIKRLGRFRRLLAVIEFGVDVVLDQRHLVAAQQLDQLLLLRLGHGRAHRVLETGHAPAGLDRVALQGLREHAQVDTVARVHRDLDGFEFQPFQDLQAGIERWRFNGHQVAGFGDRLQAQVQGFQRAVGNQQFFHRQHQAADHVAQGNLAPQLRVARRHVGDDHARVHVPCGAGQGAGQALQREQGRAGKGRAEGHGGRVLDRVEDRKHQLADVDFGGFIDLAADHRLRERTRRVRVDEIAGTRPGADQATAFEQVVGLEYRGGADPVSLAGIAHRRHALARAQDAGANQFSDVFGEFFVAFHRVPGLVFFSEIEVTSSRASTAPTVSTKP